MLVLAKPFTGVQFRQAVQMAAACCRRLDYLRQENDKLRDKIAQIRLVDRAKCYLIEHKGMSEAEAHRMIEKTAMDTRRETCRIFAAYFQLIVVYCIYKQKKAEGDLPVNILIVADEPRPDRAGGCRLPASVGGDPAG